MLRTFSACVCVVNVRVRVFECVSSRGIDTKFLAHVLQPICDPGLATGRRASTPGLALTRVLKNSLFSPADAHRLDSGKVSPDQPDLALYV